MVWIKNNFSPHILFYRNWLLKIKYANLKSIVNIKIAKGIQQLDNGEGKDCGMFLNEMQASYGKRNKLKQKPIITVFNISKHPAKLKIF